MPRFVIFCMNINTNFLNKVRYTFYTPVYDHIVRLMDHARRTSIELLNIKRTDKVLIVGAGTGLDLEYIPPKTSVTAIDLTPSMVAAMNKKAPRLDLNLKILVMDGHQLDFPDNSFDKVILHLIIAVIPDPMQALKEVERVLKPGGEITVMDKFFIGEKPSFVRRFLNPLTNFFFSDITRNFEKLIANTNLRISLHGPEFIYGIFRIYQAKKNGTIE